MWHPDQKSSETDVYHYKYSQRILQWERQLRSVVWFSLCLLMKNHVYNRTWVHFFWTQMQGNGKSRCQVVYKLLHHSNLVMTAGSQGSHGGSPIENHSLPPAFIWIHLGFSHRIPVCVLCLIYVFGFALQPQFTLEPLCAYDTLPFFMGSSPPSVHKTFCTWERNQSSLSSKGEGGWRINTTALHVWDGCERSRWTESSACFSHQYFSQTSHMWFFLEYGSGLLGWLGLWIWISSTDKHRDLSVSLESSIFWSHISLSEQNWRKRGPRITVSAPNVWRQLFSISLLDKVNTPCSIGVPRLLQVGS